MIKKYHRNNVIICILSIAVFFVFCTETVNAHSKISNCKVSLESYVYNDSDCYKVIPNGDFVEGSTPWKHLLEYTFSEDGLGINEKMCVRIKIKLTNESRGYVGQTLSLMCKDSVDGRGRTVFSERIDYTAINSWQTIEFYFTPGENEIVPASNAYMIYFCVGSTEELFTPDKYYYLSNAEFETAGGLDVSFVKRTAQCGAVIVENHTAENIEFKGCIIIACYNETGCLKEVVISKTIDETIEAYEGFASSEVTLLEDVQIGDMISVFLFDSLETLKPLKKQIVEYLY